MLSTALTIAIPTFAVMLGVTFNRQDANALRGEMANLRADMSRDMTALRDSIHRDMVPLHERMAVVETKQGN